MTNSRGSVTGPHNEADVMFYGLSTCIWCKRTRQLLEDLGVQFDYIYVDLLRGQEREDVMKEVRAWNAAASFPTLVVNNAYCVVGYKPDEIKALLGL